LVEADSSNVATAMYSYHPEYVDAVAVRIRDADGHFYLHDANYNVTAVMDDAGAVVERYSYTPYGEATVLDPNFSVDSDGVSDIGNEYLYTGRRRDPETGLQLNRNRFYHAPLGRWVNRDPIGYEGSEWNLYEYVGGMPTRFVDPSGFQFYTPYPPGTGLPPMAPIECCEKNWESTGFTSRRECILSLLGNANEPVCEILIIGGIAGCFYPPLGVGIAGGLAGQYAIADAWCNGCAN